MSDMNNNNNNNAFEDVPPPPSYPAVYRHQPAEQEQQKQQQQPDIQQQQRHRQEDAFQLAAPQPPPPPLPPVTTTNDEVFDFEAPNNGQDTAYVAPSYRAALDFVAGGNPYVCPFSDPQFKQEQDEFQRRIQGLQPTSPAQQQPPAAAAASVTPPQLQQQQPQPQQQSSFPAPVAVGGNAASSSSIEETTSAFQPLPDAVGVQTLLPKQQIPFKQGFQSEEKPVQLAQQELLLQQQAQQQQQQQQKSTVTKDDLIIDQLRQESNSWRIKYEAAVESNKALTAKNAELQHEVESLREAARLLQQQHKAGAGGGGGNQQQHAQHQPPSPAHPFGGNQHQQPAPQQRPIQQQPQQQTQPQNKPRFCDRCRRPALPGVYLCEQCSIGIERQYISILPSYNNQLRFYNKNDPFYEFTNFYPVEIVYHGKPYFHSEGLFQAAKFMSTAPQIAEQIRCAYEPRQAFDIAHQYYQQERKDWLQVRDYVMLEALRLKFKNPHCRRILMCTGQMVLIEHTNKDNYWGNGGNDSGKNRLGMLLMQVRHEIQTGKLQ